MPSELLSRQVRRFAVSGVLVTGFHVLVAASLIRLLQAPPVLANGVAFILATVVSYSVNTLWSFSRPLHGTSLIRFLVVSLFGLALTVAISGLAELCGLSAWLGIAGVVCTVPPITLLMHKAWTYRDDRSEGGPQSPGFAAKGDPGLWLAMLNGVAMFLATTHGLILDPRNTDWLMRGDPAAGYLGWRMFRQAPLFQLPFGASRNYGMEVGSSVVFSDSIPLLAFLFKPFTSWLPDAFQYVGMWILLSFVLQSVLAYKLLRRFSGDPWLAWIGSAFFTIAPICVARLEGHFALFGQWLVLAALYLYFARRFSLASWMVLLGTSALVHFYFLGMVGFIWAAGDLWQRRWRNEISTAQAATYLLTGAALTLAIMWFAGYFMIGHGAGQQGFGLYRMNLLAPIDPDELWSRLLPDQPSEAGEYEGFNYLGIGIIFLALVAAWELIRWRRQTAFDRRSMVPLLVVSVGFTVLALSNQVNLGHVDLVVYQVPDHLRPVADAFRSSGRMFWPVYYVIYAAIFAVLFRRLTYGMAISLCTASLALQVADSSAAFRHYREQLAYPPAWSSPFKSPLWAEIGRRYKRVAYVLPRNAPETFLPLTAFAADHGMATNFGYFARVDPEKLDAAKMAMRIAVRAGRLEPDSLYVFEHETLWRAASAQNRPADVVGVLDGFRIIAPNLRACAECDLRALGDVRADTPVGGR